MQSLSFASMVMPGKGWVAGAGPVSPAFACGAGGPHSTGHILKVVIRPLRSRRSAPTP